MKQTARIFVGKTVPKRCFWKLFRLCRILVSIYLRMIEINSCTECSISHLMLGHPVQNDRASKLCDLTLPQAVSHWHTLTVERRLFP